MAEIIPSPAARRVQPATASPAARGVGAVPRDRSDSMDRLPAAAEAAAAQRPEAASPLDAQVAQMRTQSQALVRSLRALQAAVHDPVDADLPAQARALIDAMADRAPTCGAARAAGA